MTGICVFNALNHSALVISRHQQEVISLSSEKTWGQSQEKETVAYDCGTWTAAGVEKNLSMNDGRQGLACIEKKQIIHK